MPRTQSLIAAATLTLALSGTAHAGEGFVFDFAFDQAAAQTDDAGAILFENLKTEIVAECDIPVRQALGVVSHLEQRCLEETLEDAVKNIDADGITNAYTAWRSDHEG